MIRRPDAYYDTSALIDDKASAMLFGLDETINLYSGGESRPGPTVARAFGEAATPAPSTKSNRRYSRERAIVFVVDNSTDSSGLANGG